MKQNIRNLEVRTALTENGITKRILVKSIWEWDLSHDPVVFPLFFCNSQGLSL